MFTRDEKLYNALKEYCRVALVFLDQKLKSSEETPFTLRGKIKVNDSGGFSHTYEEEIDWAVFCYKNEKALEGLDVFQEAVYAMKKNQQVIKHLDTLVGTAKSRMRVECGSAIRSLLITTLHEQHGTNFHESTFDRIYEGFEDYFYRDALEYRYFSPLYHFKMETERIELGSDFALIRIPKREREEILSCSGGLFSFLPNQVQFSEYTFEFYTQELKIIGERVETDRAEFPDQEVRKNFDEAISALRLFKNGGVAYSTMWRKPKIWEPSSGAIISSLPGRGVVLGADYVLSKQEIPVFMDFWNLYRKVRKKDRKRIEIALRRFNFSYERVAPEDMLIDYLIGFEALLLSRDERQELEYRLALRGAFLLGTTTEERKKIFFYLKTAYRERSNIVHGGSVKKVINIGNSNIQFGEFVYRVGEYLRAAIKKFLELCEEQNEYLVIKSLDEKIVAS